MQGAGDAWVYGKLTAETGRLASDLERTALLLQAQPSPASTDPLSATEQDARARILRANQTLEQSNVYVRDTARLVVEARDVGVNTLGAMDEQREQLITAQRDIQDADGAMNSARQVLTRMAKRALVNKIFLWVVVLVLVLINVMFFYYAFLQK
jgi:t-SNARE complex subunit (syntaxin)